MTNKLLIEAISKAAAQILYANYDQVRIEDAFEMAVGEAEIEFDTDIKIKFDETIASQILTFRKAV